MSTNELGEKARHGEPAGRAGPFGRALHRLATWLAILGGLLLLAIVVVTVASVVGRSLVNQPIRGDFELVEMGCAIAIFAFLPYCQLVRGNVVVDFITARAPWRLRLALELTGNAMFTAIAALLAWRLALGGLELQRFGESTMVLRLPVWLGFLPAFAALAFLVVVCAYTTWRSWEEYRQGRRIEPIGGLGG